MNLATELMGTGEGGRAEIPRLWHMREEIDWATLPQRLKPMKATIDESFVPLQQAEALEAHLLDVVPHQA